MEKLSEKSTKKQPWFWSSAVASVILRLVLIIYFPNTLNFSSRPEVSTPLTNLRRLAEGYWLKQSSMSPYAGLYIDEYSHAFVMNIGLIAIIGGV
ncbi:hypothetical protein L2E82_32445 [Cichorium intybus]|uniref:Uncharacterized protein n=1 Tax=Cichorium intybus TaxID=13427 RepID=A0ACB9BHM5_CICIN|nr:hypothetical protein L2E82_32445 [Cichorium intybus]